MVALLESYSITKAKIRDRLFPWLQENPKIPLLRHPSILGMTSTINKFLPGNTVLGSPSRVTYFMGKAASTQGCSVQGIVNPTCPLTLLEAELGQHTK